MFKLRKEEEGFTLIELLVVIAIIGILSSVVLASLNSARAKGSDAAVKSEVSSIKAEGAIFYDTNNTYVGLFADGTQGKKLLDSATSKGDLSKTAVSTSSITSFAVSVPLKSVTNGWFCIDDSGNSTTTIGAAATISATDANCNN